MRQSGGTTTTVPSSAVAIAALAVRPVAIIAGLLGVALLATSGRYGYFGDEFRDTHISVAAVNNERGGVYDPSSRMFGQRGTRSFVT